MSLSHTHKEKCKYDIIILKVTRNKLTYIFLLLLSLFCSALNVPTNLSPHIHLFLHSLFCWKQCTRHPNQLTNQPNEQTTKTKKQPETRLGIQWEGNPTECWAYLPSAWLGPGQGRQRGGLDVWSHDSCHCCTWHWGWSIWSSQFSECCIHCRCSDCPATEESIFSKLLNKLCTSKWSWYGNQMRWDPLQCSKTQYNDFKKKTTVYPKTKIKEELFFFFLFQNYFIPFPVLENGSLFLVNQPNLAILCRYSLLFSSQSSSNPSFSGKIIYDYLPCLTASHAHQTVVNWETQL